MTTQWDYGLHIHSFNLDMRGAIIPTAGGAQATINRFLYIAHEAQIDRIWLTFRGGDASKSSASFTAKVVQRLEDGRERDVTKQLTIDSLPSRTIVLPLQTSSLDPGWPVYFRMVFSPSILTPWFASVEEISGTIHFLMTD